MEEHSSDVTPRVKPVWTTGGVEVDARREPGFAVQLVPHRDHILTVADEGMMTARDLEHDSLKRQCKVNRLSGDPRADHRPLWFGQEQPTPRRSKSKQVCALDGSTPFGSNPTSYHRSSSTKRWDCGDPDAGFLRAVSASTTLIGPLTASSISKSYRSMGNARLTVTARSVHHAPRRGW